MFVFFRFLHIYHCYHTTHYFSSFSQHSHVSRCSVSFRTLFLPSVNVRFYHFLTSHQSEKLNSVNKLANFL